MSILYLAPDNTRFQTSKSISESLMVNNYDSDQKFYFSIFCLLNLFTERVGILMSLGVKILKPIDQHTSSVIKNNVLSNQNMSLTIFMPG